MTASASTSTAGSTSRDTADHGIRVLDPDGTEVDFLAIPGRGVTTNCCFGGEDLPHALRHRRHPGSGARLGAHADRGAAVAPVARPGRGGVASSSQRSSTPGATYACRHLHRERRPTRASRTSRLRDPGPATSSCASRPAASATPTSRSSTERFPCRRPRSSGTRAPASSKRSAPRSGSLAKGDRVIGSFIPACGTCWFCKNHQSNLCENTYTVMMNPRATRSDGIDAAAP